MKTCPPPLVRGIYFKNLPVFCSDAVDWFYSLIDVKKGLYMDPKPTCWYRLRFKNEKRLLPVIYVVPPSSRV